MRSAVVTGAGGAIGGAIATALRAEGWHLLGVDLHFDAESEARLDRAVVCDIAESDRFRGILDDLAEAHDIRCLVNCAGWCPVGPFFDSDESTWRRASDVNFIAPLVACHTLVPRMMAAGGGRVVNITSEGSRTGASGIAVYGATKGALLSFSKSLAQESAPGGVTVNCVSPGTIDTPMTAPNREMAEKMARRIPMRRLGRPEDVANAVAFLARDASEYITGQVLSVGGGLTMIG